LGDAEAHLATGEIRKMLGQKGLILNTMRQEKVGRRGRFWAVYLLNHLGEDNRIVAIWIVMAI
jgi:hypothetical protein